MKFKENSSEEKEELKVEIGIEQEDNLKLEEGKDKPKLTGKDNIFSSLIDILKIRMNVVNNSIKEIESILVEMKSLLDEGNC